MSIRIRCLQALIMASGIGAGACHRGEPHPTPYPTRSAPAQQDTTAQPPRGPPGAGFPSDTSAGAVGGGPVDTSSSSEVAPSPGQHAKPPDRGPPRPTAPGRPWPPERAPDLDLTAAKPSRPATAAPGGEGIGDSVFRRLHPGEVELSAKKQMTQGTAEVVTLRLAKDTVLPAEAPAPGVERQRKSTSVGDSAKACLDGGDDFEIKSEGGYSTCDVQLLRRGAENRWQWRVTPKSPGDRRLLVATLEQIFSGASHMIVYHDSLAIAVAVKPCPLYRLECLGPWLTTVKGVLITIGSITTIISGWWFWLRKRIGGGTGR
jgi:hypothetical protein